jgi:hypothetical protein
MDHRPVHHRHGTTLGSEPVSNLAVVFRCEYRQICSDLGHRHIARHQSKKQFVLAEVHDSGAKSLFALSLYYKTDARPLVSVVPKEKTGAVPTVEDPTIHDILNAENFSMVSGSEQAGFHGASFLLGRNILNPS